MDFVQKSGKKIFECVVLDILGEIEKNQMRPVMHSYELRSGKDMPLLCKVAAESVDDAMRLIGAKLGKRLTLGRPDTVQEELYSLREVVVNCYYTEFDVYEPRH